MTITVFGTEEDDLQFVVNGQAFFALGGNDTIHGSEIGRAKWEEIDVVNAFTGDLIHVPANTFDRYQLFADGGNGIDTYKISGDDLIQFFGFGFTLQNIERIESVDTSGPIILNMTSALENFGDMTVITSYGDDVIWSSNGSDFLDSKDGNDIVRGAGGNDNIKGGSGNDTLYGDEGNDTILGYDPDQLQIDFDGFAGGGFEPSFLMGEGEINNLYGGDGNDTIDNGAAGGFIYGGQGNDTLQGFSRFEDGSHKEGDSFIIPPQNSPASLFGEDGEDKLFDGLHMDGGDGNDTIKNSGLQFSTAYGGDGEDTIDIVGVAYGGNGDDHITSHLFVYEHVSSDSRSVSEAFAGGSFYGEEGNDTIDVSGFGRWRSFPATILNGGDGDDTLLGRGEDIYYGGDGNDTITNKTSRFVYFSSRDDGDLEEHEYTNNAQVFAGEGNDVINASGLVYGEAGNDYIYGGGGTLFGGDGDDTIDVESQRVAYENDAYQEVIVFGGRGNDTVRDNSSSNTLIRNTLNGDEGNDKLYASQSGGLLNGGDGDDILYGNLGSEHGDVLNGGKGNDTIYAGGGSQNTLPLLSVVPVSVNNLPVVYSINFIDGGDGNDLMHGSYNNDLFKGQNGDDAIFGHYGNDILWGNEGDDILNGGADADWVKGGGGTDLFILDNLHGVDTIADFRTNEKIDLTTLLGGSIGFLASQAFTKGYLRFEQDGVDTNLYIDLDGSLGANSEQLLAILLDTQASRYGLSNFILPVVNTPPIAKDDSFTGQEDTPLSGNVLADNGFGPDADADGHTLNVFAANITTATGGTVALLGNGAFIYTPKPNFFGNDSFEYTLNDGHGGSDIGKVNIALADVPESGQPLFLSGDSANNTLIGSDFDDTLKGQAGDDVLIGNSGRDTLWGNNGNDILYGGRGADWMKGGDGADLFVLDGVNDNHPDTIDDLRISRGDRIQIKDILSYDPVNDAITDFVRISQNGGDSVLSVDVDGTVNGASFADAAHLKGITGLDVNQLYNDGDLIIRHIVV